MPEYLAPGVYVEEKSFRSKNIEGVSTTTTGFVGPARYGPVTEPADIITSLSEFELIYGDGNQLAFADPNDFNSTPDTDNYLWHAARAFFTEGGTRLYVARVFRALKGDYPPPTWDNPPSQGSGLDLLYMDGHARTTAGVLTLRARFPGAASNLIVSITANAGQNILGATQGPSGGPAYLPKLGALSDRDVVVLLRAGTPPNPDPTQGELFLAIADPAESDPILRWSFQPLDASLPGTAYSVADLHLNVDPTPKAGDSLLVITLTVEVLSGNRTSLGTWSGLPLDPDHETGGEADSLFAQFSNEPATMSDARSLPLAISGPVGITGLDVLSELVPDAVSYILGNLTPQPPTPTSPPPTLTQLLTRGVNEETQLLGGNDGLRPGAPEYEGIDDQELTYKTGLKQFEDLDDISIVAAPGSTADYTTPLNRDNANAVFQLLISHAEKMRYRIAVLDSPPGMSIGDVRRVRAKMDSTYAAFYYPWVTILDPITRAEIDLPPSGFVSGIYARNDIERAVWKAPANEVVNLALGFELTLNKAQQEVLNPEGINCFRFFEDRGFRLWGARLISSDPEWRYVNLRRYFAYLEHSIDKGTQWAVFEPNGEALWANVRRTIADFLLNEWQSGALLGDKPEKAYFVRCDRSTMTQNDLDNGRLVCLIGVAPLYPAEFVIFRIGQWTADSKV